MCFRMENIGENWNKLCLEDLRDPLRGGTMPSCMKLLKEPMTTMIDIINIILAIYIAIKSQSLQLK